MAPAVWVLMLAGVLLLAGAGVLIGSRGVREIEHYRCSWCGYPVPIRPRQRCPECGADLRREDLLPPTEERRSFRVAVGACLVFFGLLIGAWGAAGLVG